MRKTTIGLAALSALALCATVVSAQGAGSGGPAATASATTVRIKGISRCVPYARDRGFPKRGTTAVDLCLGKSTGGSTPTESIEKGRTTITGHPARNTWTYKATQQAITWGVGGVRIALTGRFTINGKWVVDKAQGTVTEATGGLTGVTGTLTSTARSRVGARVVTYHSDATYTFP